MSDIVLGVTTRDDHQKSSRELKLYYTICVGKETQGINGLSAPSNDGLYQSSERIKTIYIRWLEIKLD